MIPLVIVMQPAAQMFGSLFQHPDFKYVAYLILLISLFAGIGTALEVNDQIATVGPNGYLEWPKAMPGWYAPIFFFFLIAPTLTMKPSVQGIIQFVISLLCILISWIQTPSKEFGSNWCWVTIYVLLSFYLIPNVVGLSKYKMVH